MKFIYQILATVALMALATALEGGVYVGPEAGGPHGHVFSDVDQVKPDQRVLQLKLNANDRVDALDLKIELPAKHTTSLIHGGRGGYPKTLYLAKGEHIVAMEWHTGKHYGRTRVKYIKFTTDLGNSVEGGRKTGSVWTDIAKKGYQLGGFVGRSGTEIDQIGAIWTRIAVDDVPEEDLKDEDDDK
ncbi:hypothetical protein PHMEG_00029058 [Phytophthora megakarya]|uniref:Jacalin-type lectin domain-containing protein n=1 Tax=Phytophthora megakarya TaxID=4795 RepID=A0A225V578_9STRA|nr:hypothetical protein PHMEG_00029058 [Phytophthora megakarya]